jgi:hypothetical protein
MHSSKVSGSKLPGLDSPQAGSSPQWGIPGPAPKGRHTVRAVHDKSEFPPVLEECPTPTAATIRAGQLYLFGYKVEIEPPLPKGSPFKSSSQA